jgi:hypothetical protein
MANYFVTYDLIGDNRDYTPVHEAIQQCGAWAHLEYSFFYVSSPMDLQTITQHIWNSMWSHDKLMVIDASNNNGDTRNIDPDQLEFMRAHWNQ